MSQALVTVSTVPHAGGGGATGRLHLSRVKALNALSMDMVRLMDKGLIQLIEDPAVTEILVTAEGSKAFCAGGDVKSLYFEMIDGRTGEDGYETSDFFREEYVLNNRIASCPKPFVSLLDGITMGGGVGISIMGSRRVATENLLFAMPETAIGFFPDVGGGYFMSRMGPLGTLLALTGERLKVGDCVASGIATDFIAAESREAFIADAEAAGIEAALDNHRADAPAPERFADLNALAEECFSGFDPIEMAAKLEVSANPEAPGQLKLLRRFSPLAIAVTCEQLKRASTMSFADTLIMEFRMSQAFTEGTEMREGIRSVLVDKDRNPAWTPATPEEVTKEMIDVHFAPLGERELVL